MSNLLEKLRYKGRICEPLTLNTLATKCSLMEKMVISSTVMMRSCTGLVFPRTAPKEISTVAVLKSALMILEERVFIRVN